MSKTSKIDRTKTIEEQAEQKTFFTKRNVILLICTIIVSVVLLWVTIQFVLKIEFVQLFDSIAQGFQSGWGILWFSALVLFMIIVIVYNYFPVWCRLRNTGVKINAWQYFVFGINISFLKAVTPANFVYDPYAIFWLKTHGVSTARASSIMFCNTLLWQAIQFILHIPSFIIIMTSGVDFTDPMWITVVVLMSLGLFIDVLGCLFMSLLCFSKKAHYVLSSIFNWFKKKLHMKYHTKAEIEEKYKNRATIKNDVIEYFKDWKGTIAVIIGLAVYEIVLYFAIGFSMSFINNGDYWFDFGKVYNSANMAFNANRLNIIPGFGVGLEAIMSFLLKSNNGIITRFGDVDSFVNNSIVFWRLFYTYAPALMGLFGFIGLTIVQVTRYKKKKGKFIEAKYE